MNDRPGMLDEFATRVLRARSFAHLALVDARGAPRVTPVWVDVDDEGRIIVNTAEGRVKAKLMTVGAPVGLSALDPDDPYRYVEVRGTVAERRHEGALEMIDALSRKYRGRGWDAREGEQRVTVFIEPDVVRSH